MALAWFRRTVVLAVFAVILVSLPQAAFAAGTLTDRGVGSGLTGGTDRWDYTLHNFFRYSVVGVRPASGVDFDLTVRDQNETWLQGSARGTGRVDFVVLHAGLAPFFPLDTYHADVSYFSGVGPYAIEYYEESSGPGPAAGGLYLMDTLASAGTTREGDLPISSPQFIVVTGMGFLAGWLYQITCRSVPLHIWPPTPSPSGEFFVVGGGAGSPTTSLGSAAWGPQSPTASVTVVGTDDGLGRPGGVGQGSFALVVTSTRTVHCSVTNLGPGG